MDVDNWVNRQPIVSIIKTPCSVQVDGLIRRSKLTVVDGACRGESWLVPLFLWLWLNKVARAPRSPSTPGNTTSGEDAGGQMALFPTNDPPASSRNGQDHRSGRFDLQWDSFHRGTWLPSHSPHHNQRMGKGMPSRIVQTPQHLSTHFFFLLRDTQSVPETCAGNTPIRRGVLRGSWSHPHWDSCDPSGTAEGSRLHVIPPSIACTDIRESRGRAEAKRGERHIWPEPRDRKGLTVGVRLVSQPRGLIYGLAVSTAREACTTS